MYAQRTTIILPPQLKQTVTALAREQGISFGEFVRRALRDAASRKGNKKTDPLLRDHAVYRGKTPKDLSEEHDFYLYGE